MEIKPKDWRVPEIYELIAQDMYLRLNMHMLHNKNILLKSSALFDYRVRRSRNFRNYRKMIASKVNRLSEEQKFLMTHPSEQFAYDFDSSEWILRAKHWLFYTIEQPSPRVKSAFAELENVFKMDLIRLREQRLKNHASF